MERTFVHAITEETRVVIKSTDDTLTLLFTGPINHTFESEGLVEDVKKALSLDTETVALDVGDIESMDLEGNRRWVQFLGQLSTLAQVAFERVNRIMAMAAVSYPGTLGASAELVRSFHLPYFCKKCGATHSIAGTIGDIEFDGERFKAPEKSCPSCSKDTEFDAMEDEFFYCIRPAA